MRRTETTPIQDADFNKRRLKELLNDARKRLVETGTRNKLVHTNRNSKRASNLAIFHQNPDGFFTRLVRDKINLRFRADPAATAREGQAISDADDQLITSSRELMVVSLAPPNSDVLQTRLGENKLSKKLLKFWRDAKTLEEEQGVNILYVAIGFLRWFEDDRSQVPREAPLILVSVSLERDRRSSSFTLRAREDDISTNLPLAERLRDQDEIVLPEIPDDEDWSPSDYFDGVARAISTKARWSLDRSAIEVGFFSFAKLLMFRDLSGDSWPKESILEHPLLRSLMQEGFPHEEPLLPDGIKMDEHFAPADLMQVVDADGSQTLVIETVRAGRNLVVQGPPGTGKSQTITNILAAAAHDGKKVLFIAEKMVALDVVYSKLKKVGLESLCLSLHSRSANKRSFIEDLKQTLSYASAGTSPEPESFRIKEVRDELNRITDHLHRPIGNTGTNAYRVMGDLARATGLGYPPPPLQISAAAQWDGAEYGQIKEAAVQFVQVLDPYGSSNEHPWRGVGNHDLQPFDLTRLEQRLTRLVNQIGEIENLCRLTSTVVPIGAQPCLRMSQRLLEFISLLRSAPTNCLDLLLKIVEDL